MMDVAKSSAPLPALGTETTAIIHDNLGIVLTYAFSKQALEQYQGWLRGNDGTFHLTFFVNCQSGGQTGPSSN
jgi:hypothetical protein